MKAILLLWPLVWFGCETVEECAQPSCARPNINHIIKLRLSFQDAMAGDRIGLVRIYKSEKSIIDTVQFELGTDKEIIIGGGEAVGFTEPTFGDAFEEVTLDFKVLHANVSEISDIEIMRTSSKCGCANYRIATLNFNGDIVVINSDFYELNL